MTNGRPRTSPEIKRLDLAEVVLTLKAAGVKICEPFAGWKPPAKSLLRTPKSCLLDLGALGPGEPATGITPLGRTDARVSPSSAILADAACRRGLWLRLSGLPRRGVDAGPRSAVRNPDREAAAVA